MPVPPRPALDDLPFAITWTRGRAVLSHESALALHRLSDVNPSVVHLTAPPDNYPRAQGSGAIQIHRRHLPADDITLVDGMPVTVVARTIVDCLALGTGPDQLRMAIRPMARIGVRAIGEGPSLRTVHLPSDCVAVACRAMHAAGGPLPLTELSDVAGCSPRKLQRDFEQVLGVSPRQYGASVRAMTARHTLRTSQSITDAIFDAGYGSVRAFYEGATKRLGMTPTDFAAGAPQHLLVWSTCDSAIGALTCVAGPRGICYLTHPGARDADGPETACADVHAAEEEIRRQFPKAILERDDEAMRDVMGALQLIAEGRPAPQLPVDVTGTAFQARVWAALRDIPCGETRSYAEIAKEIGEPAAIRAVGSACGANRVPLSIPCHRVVRTDGSLGGFGWGLEVKESLLAAEGHVESPAPFPMRRR